MNEKFGLFSNKVRYVYNTFPVVGIRFERNVDYKDLSAYFLFFL